MTGMYSNGNSFSGSTGNSVADLAARRVPPWKFGVGPASMTDDRAGM